MQETRLEALATVQVRDHGGFPAASTSPRTIKLSLPEDALHGSLTMVTAGYSLIGPPLSSADHLRLYKTSSEHPTF